MRWRKRICLARRERALRGTNFRWISIDQGGHSLSLYVPRLSDVPEGVSDDIGSFLPETVESTSSGRRRRRRTSPRQLDLVDNVELSRNRRSLNSEIVIAPSLSLSGSIHSRFRVSSKSSLHLHRSYLTSGLSSCVPFIIYVFSLLSRETSSPRHPFSGPHTERNYICHDSQMTASGCRACRRPEGPPRCIAYCATPPTMSFRKAGKLVGTGVMDCIRGS